MSQDIGSLDFKHFSDGDGGRNLAKQFWLLPNFDQIHTLGFHI